MGWLGKEQYMEMDLVLGKIANWGRTTTSSTIAACTWPMPPSREGRDKILWCLKNEHVKAISAKAQAIKDQGALMDNLVCTV